MGGGGGPSPPEPSAEQRELQREQAATVRQQRDIFADIARNANLLQPDLFEQIGITPIFDDTSLNARIAALENERSQLSSQQPTQRTFPNAPSMAPAFGNPGRFRQPAPVNPRFAQIAEEIAQLNSQRGQITGFDIAPDPTRQRIDSISDQFFDRTEAALAGELPVNPALLRQLEEQRQNFENSLIRDFGSLTAARNSSAGQNRIQTFDTFFSEQLETARRRDLEQARVASLQGVQASENLFNNFLQQTQGILNLPSPAAQGLGQASANFSSAIAPLQGQLNTEAQFAAANPTLAQSLGGIAGTAAGIGGGALLGNFFTGGGLPFFGGGGGANAAGGFSNTFFDVFNPF